ncbi:UDP-N-acetylglucosamine 2-epimerase (non-hydrolyzing) [Patescibacteria group bacterium]|nr:UDP-N-acetylglucosamine 2-epimerase (non-hydrolyzing) [Patescibacteria group bacterium]
MKILTIIGTRPEIIKLSVLMPLLDQLCDHKILHTGQNYTANLKDIFFKELGLRAPDYSFESQSSSPFKSIGKIMVGAEKVINSFRPDRIVIFGDTNSGLSAIVAKKMGIPVFHLEAGNRCFDDRVPEESNRRIIDTCSALLMANTERARDLLIHEGYHASRIYVVGNPIKEVLDRYAEKINSSQKLEELQVKEKKYFLATLHRTENTNDLKRLANFVSAFNSIVRRYRLPFVWSVHPRTKDKLSKLTSGIKLDKGITIVEAMGFFDFVKLEKNAYCVLSDSGTEPEECTLFGVPNVALRDTNERPEAIEAGSNILSGANADSVLLSVETVLSQRVNWTIPEEYLVPNWSNKVAKVLLGYRENIQQF